MIEIFVLTACLSSPSGSQVCNKVTDAYMNSDEQAVKEYHLLEKQFNTKYIDPLPSEMKFLGGIATTLYRKELKFVLYRGFLLDFKDKGWAGLGYRIEFP